MTDLSPREIAVFAPILVLVFFMGVYPRPLLSRMEPSIAAILARVERGKTGAVPRVPELSPDDSRIRAEAATSLSVALARRGEVHE